MGYTSLNDAIEKLNAGADLIQLYTGFVYEGPAVVKRINRAILNSKQNSLNKLIFNYLKSIPSKIFSKSDYFKVGYFN